MDEHRCDKALLVEQHGRDIAELFEKANRTVERVGEIETTLFGAERNGGGFFKTHERLHEEEDVAIKETLEVVQTGMKTISEQQHEQGKKIEKLLEKGKFAKRLIEISIAGLIPAGASVAAIILSRGAR